MLGRSSKDRDFSANTFRPVEQAIGEHLDGTPLKGPKAGKNPVAVALGNRGTKGSTARAKSLSKAKRKAIAQNATSAWWSKYCIIKYLKANNNLL